MTAASITILAAAGAGGLAAAFWWSRTPRTPGRHTRLARLLAGHDLSEAMHTAGQESSDEEAM